MSKKRDNSIADADAESDLVAFEMVESGAAEGQDGVISVLVYWVGTSSMAINVDQTEGVVDCPRVTPLPNAPDKIIGVASVRGRMTLVMDLSAGSESSAAKQRLILIKGEKQIGIVADRVERVVSLRKIVRKGNSTVRASAPLKERISQDLRVPTVCFFSNGDIDIPIVDIDRLAENA